MSVLCKTLEDRRGFLKFPLIIIKEKKSGWCVSAMWKEKGEEEREKERKMERRQKSGGKSEN
jgi:hypothetical protein